MITKSYTNILKEAAMADDFQVLDLISDEIKTAYDECIKEMVVIPKNTVAYRAEMVPVFQNESQYFVEFDNMAKYMKSAEVTDVSIALDNIAEANDIDTDKLSVVIESKEYMKSVIDEAIKQSKAGDKSLLESCELSMKLIEMMKSEGINVVTTR